MSRRCTRAFSLVEAALSVLLVGGLVVAATDGVGRVAQARLAAAQQERGVALAQRLMSEILALPFADASAGNTLIGRDGGAEAIADRSTLNDVDDADGLDESPLKDWSGDVINDTSGWRWTATVTWVDPSTLARSLTQTGVKRVSVTVYRGARKVTTLDALRTAGSDSLRALGRGSESAATIAQIKAVNLP